jgi:hypothetical protein
LKRILIPALIVLFAVSSASFAAPKRSYTRITTIKVARPKNAQPERSWLVISPKLTFMTGDYSGIAIGAEGDILTLDNGIKLGAEVNYKLSSNTISWLQAGGIGKYPIPVEDQSFAPYVGGGMNLNFYSASGGSATGLGLKFFGGSDFTVPDLATLFANIGYAFQTISVGGANYTAGGIYLEGGARFAL